MSQSKQHLQLHREALQRRSQQDWANREYVQLMAGSITRISDFLNTFSQSCSGRLANLNMRLDGLERKVIFLEKKIGCDLPISNPNSDPNTRPESEEEDGGHAAGEEAVLKDLMIFWMANDDFNKTEAPHRLAYILKFGLVWFGQVQVQLGQVLNDSNGFGLVWS